MFIISLLNLLNEYNSSSKEKNNIQRDNIKKLITENFDEFENFYSTQFYDLSSDKQDLIEDIKEEIEDVKTSNQNDNLNIENENENENSKSFNADIEKLKQSFFIWEEEFTKNNENKCLDIVRDIVNFYVKNRFEILKKFLDVKLENDNFQKFKNYILNYLRKYFSNLILDYLENEEFKNLNFFKKIKMKKKIMELTKKISLYEFDIDEINLVVKNV